MPKPSYLLNASWAFQTLSQSLKLYVLLFNICPFSTWFMCEDLHNILMFLEYFCPPFRTCLSVMIASLLKDWAFVHSQHIRLCVSVKITLHCRAKMYFVTVRYSGLVQRLFTFFRSWNGGNLGIFVRIFVRVSKTRHLWVRFVWVLNDVCCRATKYPSAGCTEVWYWERLMVYHLYAQGVFRSWTVQCLFLCFFFVSVQMFSSLCLSP